MQSQISFAARKWGHEKVSSLTSEVIPSCTTLLTQTNLRRWQNLSIATATLLLL